MDNIFKDVEDFIVLIKETKEYKDYIRINKILDSNKEINNIINKIKKIQQELVLKKSKNEDLSLLECELNLLYQNLNSFKEYKEYILISKRLNKLITKIQKKFEKEFNEILN